jgi:UDP-N-acetylmuramoylalanine--D-glutamate ligase
LLPKIKPEDWVVWELANFQLRPTSRSPHIAVCLMIAPEHQDWHPDMADYLKAKTNLFAHQKPDDIAIYFAGNEDSKKIALTSPGRQIPYYQRPGARVRDDGMIVIGENETEIIHKTKVKLLGEHNLQNICAALTAVYEATGSLDKARVILTSFSGLEHRLEFVRELEGIKYYDDSFGTTPDTAIVALQAFSQPKVVILGGSDKGVPFDSLADAVISNNVRHAVVIGETGAKIAELLKQRGFNNISTGLTDMPSIITAARKAAQPGDIVLLSTGYASFGLFKDYKDRGEQFKSAVQSLV